VRRDGRVRPVRHRALQLSALIWLTVVWMGLWGDISVANALAGLTVGVVVSLVFPLPPVRMQLRLRPLGLARLVAHFFYDVVVASTQVAWKAVFLRRHLRNAVIEVNLTTPSDFVLTVVAEMVCLVPGTVVVEARRSSHTLFLHVLDAVDQDGVEKTRQRTLELERRVVNAIGPGTTGTPSPKGAAGGGR
jgi:multicomponent Na+:H+ antiporter subunit E